MTGFPGAGRALEEIFYADTGNLMHNYVGWDTLKGRKKEPLDSIDWDNNPREYWRMSSRAVRMDLFKDEWMKDPWGMDRFAELMPALKQLEEKLLQTSIKYGKTDLRNESGSR